MKWSNKNSVSDSADESDVGLAFACDQIFSNMSEPGQQAVDVWLESEDPELPFESEAYSELIYSAPEAERAAAEELFVEAGQANKDGDRYERAASSLAMVLFFAGISLVIGWVRLRWVLLAMAGVILLVAGVYLLGLPRA